MCGMSDNKATDKIEGIQKGYNRVEAVADFIDVTMRAFGRIGLASKIQSSRNSTREITFLYELK